MAARLLNSHAGLVLGQRSPQFIHLTLVIFCLCFTISTKLAAAQTNMTNMTTEASSDLATEIVTEIVTELEEEETTTVPSTTADDTEEFTDGETTPELLTDPPGQKLVMRFTISNRNYSDIENPDEREELESLLVEELEELYSNNKKFRSVTVLEFRNGSIIVDVELEFTDALNVQERAQVFTALYEKVVLNGTLGALEVQDLKHVKDDGKIEELNDACDIRPCLQTEMKCVANGTKCTASCSDNKGYCLNNSTCRPNNDYIVCKCKKDFFGYRCDKKPLPPSGGRDDNAYIGIIAAAGIAVLLLLVMIVGCGYSRLVNRGKESDTSKLFQADNMVALEMLDEPPPVVGGVACQTIESFLLTKYMKHGIPPKPGFQHEIIQTNESFLLDKAQRERESNNVPTIITPNGTGASPPPAPAPTPVSSPVPEDQPSTEPEQGLSNEAFVEDEGDIVPTAEVVGDEAKTDIGKKIIKV
ncbi:interphotoreceptor matrix proteoglycan 2-like [Patiria miniata]|uniref:EGF-like domain-containing protein n=1 Tax=Patiria miniata TaxID=46514 RepID=A0A914A4Y8_PATMI|nr:interphotoreceptor matrix proteoglycan 2-like [Patiria miniata]